MDQMGIPGTINSTVGDVARSGRPWWQMCCGGCLVLIAAVIIGVLIFVRAVAGPGVSHPSTLPANFPREIQPYQMEAATDIAYLEGKNKGKIRETIYAPILYLSEASRTTFDELGANVQNTDSVTVTWKGLKATRTEVLDYYRSMMKQAGLVTSESHEEETRSDVITGLRQGMVAQARIVSSEDLTRLAEVELVVTYSNKQ